MTAIGQLQAELQPHKRRHSKTKFTASYGRLGSNGLTSICAVLVPSHVPVPVPTGTHVCWGVFLFRKAEELSEKSSF